MVSREESYVSLVRYNNAPFYKTLSRLWLNYWNCYRRRIKTKNNYKLIPYIPISKNLVNFGLYSCTIRYLKILYMRTLRSKIKVKSENIKQTLILIWWFKTLFLWSLVCSDASLSVNSHLILHELTFILD